MNEDRKGRTEQEDIKHNSENKILRIGHQLAGFILCTFSLLKPITVVLRSKA
jgi:hypothetical protein